jgi:SAM-dependent methyltransferase
VLDLGCGLGGPSRFIAGEYGSDVTGIDLIPEFIQTASAITEQVGLTDRVRFQIGNILDLPFNAFSFDVVWSQHTLMNIRNKAKLFKQVHHVLKPNGFLALYEVIAGDLTQIHYPVQWSSNPDTNFLIQEDQMRELLHQAGFKNIIWQETTTQCLAWFESLNKKMKSRPQNAPPPVGLNMVIGPTTAEKARNTMRNLQENRIRVIYGVFKS